MGGEPELHLHLIACQGIETQATDIVGKWQWGTEQLAEPFVQGRQPRLPAAYLAATRQGILTQLGVTSHAGEILLTGPFKNAVEEGSGPRPTWKTVQRRQQFVGAAVVGLFNDFQRGGLYSRGGFRQAGAMFRFAVMGACQ